MPEIPDVELPDSTKDMISAGVENYFKKCILDKPIIEDATYRIKLWEDILFLICA